MRYGFCADITKALTGDTTLLDRIVAAGYDFAEFSLNRVAALSDDSFAALLAYTRQYPLPLSACNCMYANEVRLTGPTRDEVQISQYTARALSRARQLGARKVVLGSNHARNIPDGYPEEQAYAEFIDLCRRVIAPIAAAEDVCVVIEPLRRPASNFIITVADGLRIVAGADHPYIQVLADTIHMLTSGESPDILTQAGAHLRHIHVSDYERALPEDGYSSQLLQILSAVVDCGYRDTISFESQLGRSEKSLFLALNLLKQKLGA